MSDNVVTGVLIIVGLLAIAWAVRIGRRVASFARPKQDTQIAAPPRPPVAMPATISADPHALCPICLRPTDPLATIDFNKSCQDIFRKVFASADVPVSYHLCSGCLFIFAPAMQQWSRADFRRWIFNEGYPLVDPEFADVRPRSSATTVELLFGDYKQHVRHLDFGRGNARLVQLMTEAGWDSTFHDALAADQDGVPLLGQFDLITAFDMLEQSPDPRALLETLRSLLKPDGVILIRTLITDGQLAEGLANWWYAAPRNGHISLYHSESLSQLAGHFGFRHFQTQPPWHVFVAENPAWAPHLFPAETATATAPLTP